MSARSALLRAFEEGRNVLPDATDDQAHAIEAWAMEALVIDPHALADEMVAFANKLIEPMLCKQPAGGLGPGSHCAACCYGSGIIVECAEDQAIADAAAALNRAAAGLYTMAAPVREPAACDRCGEHHEGEGECCDPEAVAYIEEQRQILDEETALGMGLNADGSER